MESPDSKSDQSVEIPAPTVWPLVLSLGIALLFAGLATTLVLSMVGAILLVAGLGGWISQLLPGKGHEHEALAASGQRPRPVGAKLGTVEQLRPGMPGHRFRLPEKVHPISAGVKGGIVGGLVMPIPALAYGIISGHGIWFPINLLAGMLLPGMDDLNLLELERFHFSAFVVGILIHAVISVIMGLMYGVLLPTMPPMPGGPIVFGGVVMPLLWTWASYGLMANINPLLRAYVDWPWFVLSQLVFGVAAAIVVIRTEKIVVPPAGGGESQMKEWADGGPS